MTEYASKSTISYSVEDHGPVKVPSEEFYHSACLCRTYTVTLEYPRGDGTIGESTSSKTMHLNVFAMNDGSIEVWKELWRGDQGYDPRSTGAMPPSKRLKEEASTWFSGWLEEHGFLNDQKQPLGLSDF